MADTVVKKANKLQGVLTLPGDKSISHRAALLSLLCREPVSISNYTDGQDGRHSLQAVIALGGKVEESSGDIKITPPENGLISPADPIDCGNSGTTMRLLAGLLCGASVSARLIGDQSLMSRPMERLVNPLRQMNASIETEEKETAPLTISPALLIPLDYTLPIASAQVKSALLLAGLASGTAVTIREKNVARDHTERMLRYLGANIHMEDVKPEIAPDPADPRKKIKWLTTEAYRRSITLEPKSSLGGGEISIPGDISTAAFFIAAALMRRGSHVIIKDVGVNPTRTGFIATLRQMDADITIKNRREICGEPRADIEVRYSQLKPRKISGEVIPSLIDELPIIAVLAAGIEGTTIVRGAEELRHKESDRIRAICENLQRLGVKVGEFPDGFAVEGGGELAGAELDSFGDHRIAMAFAVAGLSAHGTTVIHQSDAIAVSCPTFFTLLDSLRVN